MTIIHFVSTDDLKLTAAIFCISLIGFTALSCITYDAAKLWRAVDYPWVFFSLGAVIIALANLSAATRLQELEGQRSAYVFGLKNTIDAANAVKDNVCGEHQMKSYDLTSLNFKGCQQINNLISLSKASLAFTEVGGSGMYEEGLLDFQNLLNGFGYQQSGPPRVLAPFPPFSDEMPKDPDGWWKLLSNNLGSTLYTRKSFSDALSDSIHQDGDWRFELIGTDIRYWYIVIAFFVGLRLSRTTAEILQARKSQAH